MNLQWLVTILPAQEAGAQCSREEVKIPSLFLSLNANIAPAEVWRRQRKILVNNERPTNLDIGSIKLPITAYVSILHRVSGVITFFSLAILLWLLDQSLTSELGFESVKSLFNHPLLKFIVWGCLAALAYHLVLGLRHLVMDMGVGEESFSSGRISAWIAATVAVVAMAMIAGWVFL